MEQLNQFIENKNFILWVFEPDLKLETWWNQFETDHPEQKRNILLARNVLLKFRTSNEKLTEEEKNLLFSRILKRVEEKQSGGKYRRLIMGFMRCAAVALLFFSAGALHANNEDKLPIYQHDLLALIAPRAVYLALQEAQSVYLLYGFNTGLPDEMPALNQRVIRPAMSFHIREGKHNMMLFDCQQFIRFADSYFKEKQT